MSLPTRAAFYRGEKIVGVGFCNPGWVLNPNTLKSCVSQAMNHAWDFYRSDEEAQFQMSPEDKLRHQEYFTTEDDLKFFDYVKIFDIVIPRHLAMSVYFKKK